MCSPFIIGHNRTKSTTGDGYSQKSLVAARPALYRWLMDIQDFHGHHSAFRIHCINRISGLK